MDRQTNVGGGGRQHSGGGRGQWTGKIQSPARGRQKIGGPDRPINTDGWRRYDRRRRRDRSDCFILFARQTGDLMRLICGRSVCCDAKRDCYRWLDSDTSQSLPVCPGCLFRLAVCLQKLVFCVGVFFSTERQVPATRWCWSVCAIRQQPPGDFNVSTNDMAELPRKAKDVLSEEVKKRKRDSDCPQRWTH